MKSEPTPWFDLTNNDHKKYIEFIENKHTIVNNLNGYYAYLNHCLSLLPLVPDELKIEDIQNVENRPKNTLTCPEWIDLHEGKFTFNSMHSCLVYKYNIPINWAFRCNASKLWKGIETLFPDWKMYKQTKVWTKQSYADMLAAAENCAWSLDEFEEMDQILLRINTRNRLFEQICEIESERIVFWESLSGKKVWKIKSRVKERRVKLEIEFDDKTTMSKEWTWRSLF